MTVMKTLSKPALALAICLSALAGYVDVLGFIQLGGYFVSFMSGNSTRLAASFAEAGNYDALFILAIILVFVFGSMAGALISHFSTRFRRTIILCIVGALLSGASILSVFGLMHAAVILMVLAMSSENALFQRDGNVRVGLTYMTGTLVRVGQKIASSLLGIEHYGWVQPLLLWCGFISGGFLGAFMFSSVGLAGVGLAAAACFLMALTVYGRERRLKV
ncbi:MAG: DUF1275 domain-containing protein [Alphaproteobacteria bacterium]|nr:DUF1275 domain-containing protein [Alphaproteobacteria bacterium]